MDTLMEFDARKARFDRICREAMRERHTMGDAGIGTLCEKRMHAVIKRYICEDQDCHEVGIVGTRYVSDVRIGNDAYEVQTGAFYPMRKKIAYYLEHTDMTVTVVHPVSIVKWLCWIDPQSKEISPRKRVARTERREDLLAELYSLLPYLGNPRLKFRLLLLETQDFRIKESSASGRNKGTKYERVPISLLGEECFFEPRDFASLVPTELCGSFTVKQFSNATKLRGRDAYSAVRVLCALGLLAEAAPIGRAMAFVKTF